jgi:Kef-type K+ transport system membrane component KefB
VREDAPVIDQGAVVDVGSFLVVVTAAALGGTIAGVAGGRGWLVPAVVCELVLGVLVGPQLLGLAKVTSFIDFFANLGLGMLFFFAGYEIDVRRIKGEPLKLAVLAWLVSLALAYTVGGLLAAAGIVLSLVYTGSALATTAIGTLIPILSDHGELKTRFGTYLLAAGAIGEFGPIMLLTLLLTTTSPVHNAVVLIVFVLLAVGVAVVTVRSAERTLPLLRTTIDKSSQLAVRWIMVLVFVLAFLAEDLGLDLLLGGFAAGMITREVLRGREIETFDAKLTAVAFGFFVPFFFVVSGMELALSALFTSWHGVAKLAIFLVLFLLVRGLPALLLYRSALDRRDRVALGFFTSTQLPLVIAITTVAVEAGHMIPETQAALVAAAVLSTVIYPLVGLRLRARSREAPA